MTNRLTLPHASLWAWGLGLICILLVAVFPGPGMSVVFIGSGLISVLSNRLPKWQIMALFWSMNLLALSLGTVFEGTDSALVGLEIALMSYLLTISIQKELDIPRVLILNIIVVSLFYMLFLGMLVHSVNTWDEVLVPFQKGIEKGLLPYKLSEQEIKEITDTLIKFVPSVIGFSILIITYSNIITANWFAKRFLRQSPVFTPSFELFRLPDWFIWVGIFAGAGALILKGMINIVCQNILFVVLGLYCIQGAAMLKFYLGVRGVHKAIQAGIFILISCFWYGLLGLTVLGVTDVWTNHRKIPIENNQGGS